jgi:hypothetical protein
VFAKKLIVSTHMQYIVLIILSEKEETVSVRTAFSGERLTADLKDSAGEKR